MITSLKSTVAKFSALLALSLFIPTSAMAAAAAGSPDLKSGDLVGVSFWVISMALVAATAFFFLEIQRVAPKWKTSLTVSGLVTLVAATHYFYMRDVWVTTGATPTVFRYIDWLITVPLLMVEFYIILSAVTKVSGGVFWRLMIGTLVMLIGGYLGEAGLMSAWPAFASSAACFPLRRVASLIKFGSGFLNLSVLIRPLPGGGGGPPGGGAIPAGVSGGPGCMCITNSLGVVFFVKRCPFVGLLIGIIFTAFPPVAFPPLTLAAIGAAPGPGGPGGG